MALRAATIVLFALTAISTQAVVQVLLHRRPPHQTTVELSALGDQHPRRFPKNNNNNNNEVDNEASLDRTVAAVKATTVKKHQEEEEEEIVKRSLKRQEEAKATTVKAATKNVAALKAATKTAAAEKAAEEKAAAKAADQKALDKAAADKVAAVKATTVKKHQEEEEEEIVKRSLKRQEEAKATTVKAATKNGAALKAATKTAAAEKAAEEKAAAKAADQKALDKAAADKWAAYKATADKAAAEKAAGDKAAAEKAAADKAAAEKAAADNLWAAAAEKAVAEKAAAEKAVAEKAEADQANAARAQTTPHPSPVAHMMAGRVPPGGHAILISLQDQPGRAARVRNSLAPIDVDFVELPAVDSVKGDHQSIHSACGFEKFPGALPDRVRAIAASHKKALELAASRQEEWTLILEDDVALLPVRPVDWLAGFDAAWEKLKHRDVAVVRLGWCEFAEGKPEVEALGHGFQLVHRIKSANWKDTEAPYGINNGMCSTAYIVNKKYVDTMLNAFPCHEPVDLFYGHTLFNKPPFANKVWSIDHENSTQFFDGWSPFRQHGLLGQMHLKDWLKLQVRKHQASRHTP